MSGAVVLFTVLATAPWWRGREGRVQLLARRHAADERTGRTVARGGTPWRARVGGLPGPVGRAWRWVDGRPPHGDVELDGALLLELVAAALAAGAPVPRALSTIAEALPGTVGTALSRAAGALALGSSWSAAWHGSPAAVAAVGDALEPTATTGASPVPLLRSAAAALRRRRRSAGRAAAGRLGVWLVLPLGLCFLPAFLLLGVVPVVLSIAGRLLG